MPHMHVPPLTSPRKIIVNLHRKVNNSQKCIVQAIYYLDLGIHTSAARVCHVFRFITLCTRRKKALFPSNQMEGRGWGD